MPQRTTAWMKYSIDIARAAPNDGLRVGVALVSASNNLICSAYAGEDETASWSSVLLTKAHQLNVSTAQSIYLTVNTLRAEAHTFDLLKVLQEICIEEIYIGLPDPALTHYLEGDPVIAHKHIYRYPIDLQCAILQQNTQFFAASPQSIQYSPYYSQHRISSLVIETLKSKGLVISKAELNEHKSQQDLASFLSDKYHMASSEAMDAVSYAMAQAFNNKYGAYNYSDDTRSFDTQWQSNFATFYQAAFGLPMPTINILNVGVGSGHEATALFSKCKQITFVDIAADGLNNVKQSIPSATTIVANADRLVLLDDNSYDLYVSLRTYNSSFFNIKGALSEAHRVLKPNATIIISVANGFLSPEQHRIIPGLIIPGTEFVDIYRGLDTAKIIETTFTQIGFTNIHVFPTNSEIYLSGVAT